MTERATRAWTASLLLVAALLLALTQLGALAALTLPLWGVALGCMLAALVVALRHHLTGNRRT